MPEHTQNFMDGACSHILTENGSLNNPSKTLQKKKKKSSFSSPEVVR
jgi:hypothetical protein